MAKSKAIYEASEAHEAIGGDFAPAEESPELSEKVASVRQPAPTTATSSATQTETSSGPATVSVVDGGSFSDGSLAGASPAELDRAEMGFLHTMRPDLVAVSSSEHLGCPTETMAGAMSLISGEPSAVEPLRIVGIAETEGERPFKGLELSTSVLSPPRVGIEANQSILALSEVETAYAVEALGEAESSSPLMSINPLGVIVEAELIKNTELDHRILATATLISIGTLWWSTRKLDIHPAVKSLIGSTMGMAALQVTLGISTLLSYVPVSLGTAHQAGALTLLTLMILLNHTVRRPSMSLLKSLPQVAKTT
ncbi:hypothetical protein CMV_012396 [Castanea mollissima]|uniref:Uncharacterized protein n=1 Tax=Castanea mollissima TaxID=60419 RepID=A0A8J4VJ43_9ROSI|nr:hypothetical protein CMV_012396 [Castanea mollissima]